jgi:hypothetical protein
LDVGEAAAGEAAAWVAALVAAAVCACACACAFAGSRACGHGADREGALQCAAGLARAREQVDEAPQARARGLGRRVALRQARARRAELGRELAHRVASLEPRAVGRGAQRRELAARGAGALH